MDGMNRFNMLVIGVLEGEERMGEKEIEEIMTKIFPNGLKIQTSRFKKFSKTQIGSTRRKSSLDSSKSK